ALHDRAVEFRAAPRRRSRRAARACRDSRQRAEPPGPAARLRLPSALRVLRARHLRSRYPAARHLRAGPRCALPALAHGDAGRVTGGGAMTAAPPLLEIRHLKTWFDAGSGVFARGKGYVKAVDDVSFSICTGEVLGLV